MQHRFPLRIEDPSIPATGYIPSDSTIFPNEEPVVEKAPIPMHEKLGVSYTVFWTAASLAFMVTLICTVLVLAQFTNIMASMQSTVPPEQLIDAGNIPPERVWPLRPPFIDVSADNIKEIATKVKNNIFMLNHLQRACICPSLYGMAWNILTIEGAMGSSSYINPVFVPNPAAGTYLVKLTSNGHTRIATFYRSFNIHAQRFLNTTGEVSLDSAREIEFPEDRLDITQCIQSFWQ